MKIFSSSILLALLITTSCQKNENSNTSATNSSKVTKKTETQFVDHDSSKFQRSVDIAVGPGISCAILENGDGKCWGSSFFGTSIFNGIHWKDFENASVIGGGLDAACAAVGIDRELQCTGYSVRFDLHKGPKLKGVTEISMDTLIGCAISGNLVTCWGHDIFGQPAPGGFGLYNPRHLRVYDTMSCVASDGGVACWNHLGWGLDAPKDLKHVSDLAVREFDACATDDVRGLVCWHSYDDMLKKGYTEYPVIKNTVKMSNLHFGIYKDICGVRGPQIQCYDLNGLENRTLPLPIKNASKLVIGSVHTCGLTDQGVECIGQNQNGEVSVPRGLNKPFQIAASMNFTCVLATNGLRCWGDNYYDQITPPFTVKNPTQIATNGYTTCIDDEDKFRCWTRKQTGIPGGIEYNLSSELHGAKSIMMARDLATDIVCGIKDSKVFCWNSLVNGLTNPRDLSVNKNFGCAISDDGVRCWDFGYATLSSKLLPISLANPSLLSVDEAISCAVTDQTLKCWDKTNKLVPTPSLTNIRELRVKNRFGCAISEDNVNCWNYDYSGSTFEMKSVPNNLDAPRGLTMSETNACVITNSGVRCWGLYSGIEMLIPDYNLVK